jgi:hypothetical protein
MTAAATTHKTVFFTGSSFNKCLRNETPEAAVYSRERVLVDRE